MLLLFSILSPLLPIGIGIKKKAYSLLWLYPITGIFFDLLITFLKRVLYVSYLWPANIFILLEFIILSLLYREKLLAHKRLFNLYIAVASALFIVHTINYSPLRFNMIGAGLFMILYIFYGLAGLYIILTQQKIMYLERSWFFWLNVAVIIYASGNCLLFLFENYMMTNNPKLYLALWGSVFFLLNIIKNILLGVALYQYKNIADRDPG